MWHASPNCGAFGKNRGAFGKKCCNTIFRTCCTNPEETIKVRCVSYQNTAHKFYKLVAFFLMSTLHVFVDNTVEMVPVQVHFVLLMYVHTYAIHRLHEAMKMFLSDSDHGQL